jgi:hypothetical protein
VAGRSGEPAAWLLTDPDGRSCGVAIPLPGTAAAAPAAAEEEAAAKPLRWTTGGRPTEMEPDAAMAATEGVIGDEAVAACGAARLLRAELLFCGYSGGCLISADPDGVRANPAGSAPDPALLAEDMPGDPNPGLPAFMDMPDFGLNADGLTAAAVTAAAAVCRGGSGDSGDSGCTEPKRERPGADDRVDDGSEAASEPMDMVRIDGG